MDQLPDPGWYLDPDDPQRLRWWTGQRWSEHRATTAADGPLDTQQVDRRRVAQTTDAVIDHAFDDLGTLSFDNFWNTIYSLWILAAMAGFAAIAAALLTGSATAAVIAAIAVPILLLWVEKQKRRQRAAANETEERPDSERWQP